MRLVKGAKETFGWVIVSPDREVIIPPQAWEQYGFRVQDEAIFIRGSRKSGGFGLTTQKLSEGLIFTMEKKRILGTGCFTSEHEIRLPEAIPLNPGDRLLTAFGSSLALGFISQEPIYEETDQHPELAEFKKE